MRSTVRGSQRPYIDPNWIDRLLYWALGGLVVGAIPLIVDLLTKVTTGDFNFVQWLVRGDLLLVAAGLCAAAITEVSRSNSTPLTGWWQRGRWVSVLICLLVVLLAPPYFVSLSDVYAEGYSK